MQCFILAGGFATRLWPLTERRAKPLLPLVGKPLLTHIVESIPEGIAITASTNAEFAESMAEWQKTLRRPVTVIVEKTRSDKEKLGALGALAQWMRETNVQDDILLLAGDNYLGFKMSDFLASYTPGVPLLAVREIGDRAAATKFGTVVLQPGTRRMALYEEKPKEPKSSLVSTTCAVFPPSVFPLILNYSLTHPDNNGGVWEQFLLNGVPCEAFPFTESWFDIGSYEAYLSATTTLVGQTVQADPTASFIESTDRGSVVLGAHSRVVGSELTDTVLFEDCIVENCVLDRCIVDRGCVLKGIDLSGKMLRAGTILTR